MEFGIQANGIWKKFRRGEKTSLRRDVIPGLVSRIMGRPTPSGNKTFWALKEVSFKVKRGEILGIVGANGAGKTTVLKLLAGLMWPDKGSIDINGRVSSLIIAGAGFNFEFTGRENIYLNGAFMGMKKQEIDRKFDSIVEFAGSGLPDYGKFIDTPLKRYSSGMFVRLGFSIAAHIDPEVLLVDEVLAVGDISFQRKCLEFMNGLKKSDSAIVMVSHNMRQITNFCDRAILLKNGQVALEGSSGKVVDAFEKDMHKGTDWQGKENVPQVQAGGGVVLTAPKFENTTHSSKGLQLRCKDPIIVSFDYDSLDYPVEDLTFALIVYQRQSGGVCFGVSSHMYGCRLKKKGRARVVIKEHNLLPADYTFDIQIRSRKDNVPLAVYRENRVALESADLQLDPHISGIYQPKGVSWSVS